MSEESVTEEQLTAHLSESTVTETADTESESEDLSGITDHYKSEEIALPEDIEFLYEVELSDSNEIRLLYNSGKEGLKEYITDKDISHFSFIDREIPQECISADQYYPTNDLGTYSDGCIVYLLEDHGGISAPDEFDENFDYDSYISNCKLSYIMAEYKDGKVVRTIPFQFPEGTDSLKNLMQVVDFEDQMLFVKGAGELYRINKADGSVSMIADLTEGISDETIEKYCFKSYITKDSKGAPYIAYTDTENGEEGVYRMCKVEDGSLSGSSFTFKLDTFFPVPGYGKYDFIVYEDNSVSGIYEDGSKETIIDVKKSGLPEMDLCALGNGEFLGYYNIGEEAVDATYEPHLVKLTPVYDSEQ